MFEIQEIAGKLNVLSKLHPIGKIQSIRKGIKKLIRPGTNKIFSEKSIQDDYAFHSGGRTELQFNIGYETVNGKAIFRHGVAFSLELSQTLPSIEPLAPKVRRFNEFLRVYPDALSEFRMWYFDNEERSNNYNVSEIPSELVRSNVFIFIGSMCLAEELDENIYEVILNDFNKFIPLYQYVEGVEFFPYLNKDKSFLFKPGCSVKASSTNASYTEKILDVNLRHNDIQHKLYDFLVKKHCDEIVGAEVISGRGGRIDLVLNLESGFYFYEIKTALSARACIREGLAQLLEYSYWPGAQRAIKIIIVGEPSIDEQTRGYLSNLRSLLSLPIYYYQFDVNNNELIE